MALTVNSWEPCRVHKGEAEVVPVAITRESYKTDVVEAGAEGSTVTTLRPSSKAVAEPNTRVNFSEEYCLNASSKGRKALEKGIRSGFDKMRGAPIFQKKWVDGEMRVTL